MDSLAERTVSQYATSQQRAFPANASAFGSPAGPVRGGLAPWQMRKIESYISDRLDSSIRIEQLASLVALSVSHFHRSFRKSFGESPYSYILGARTERAGTMMLTTSESFSQIALACGFADQTHLCRRFREATGTTPGFWRRSGAIARNPCQVDGR